MTAMIRHRWICTMPWDGSDGFTMFQLIQLETGGKLTPHPSQEVKRSEQPSGVRSSGFCAARTM